MCIIIRVFDKIFIVCENIFYKTVIECLHVNLLSTPCLANLLHKYPSFVKSTIKYSVICHSNPINVNTRITDRVQGSLKSLLSFQSS